MTQLKPAPQPVRQRATTAAILSIGTAVPHGSVSQTESADVAESFNCQTDGQRAWLRRVFSRAGVERRGTVLMNGRGAEDIREFYPASTQCTHGPTTSARMQRYAIEAPALAETAARAALRDAGLIGREPRITHLITVSCTGFFAPGLDVELISRLGLPANVQRLHVGFMGCHAAFNALAAARNAVQAAAAEGREALVLVCSVELCTLHFAYGWQPEKLVANALFADAAAACVVGPADAELSGAGPMHILQSASLLLPDSRDAMTWRVGDHGFEMTLSSELPTLIGTHIRPWCESWLQTAGASLAEIDHWALHPGGPKILAACKDALKLSETQIQSSRDILSRHGNLSSATLLFLLQHLAQQNARGKCLAVGFGPGLMAEGLLLER